MNIAATSKMADRLTNPAQASKIRCPNAVKASLSTIDDRTPGPHLRYIRIAAICYNLGDISVSIAVYIGIDGAVQRGRSQ